MQGLIAIDHLITALTVQYPSICNWCPPGQPMFLAAAAAPETLVPAISQAVIIVARGTGHRSCGYCTGRRLGDAQQDGSEYAGETHCSFYSVILVGDKGT